jgi:hypothetical protein
MPGAAFLGLLASAVLQGGALAPVATGKSAATAATIDLTEGPLRAAVRALGSDVAPGELEGFGPAGKAPGLAPGALLDAATWSLWRTALRGARDAASPAAATRARAVLALVAHEQRRWSDAWRHLEHAAHEPALLAALLPRFAPGVAAGTELAKGGRPAALPEGAVLAPALPPPPAADAGGDARKRLLAVDGLAVGAGRVAFTLTVEHEGVQAEVRLAAGTSARVAIVLPPTEEYRVGAEYVDWYRQETLGAPLVLALAPSEEPHVLFARFEPKDLSWPTKVPETLPASVAARGLWLVLPESDPDRSAWERIARELALPEASIDCRLAPGRAAPEGGVAIDLTDAAVRPEKFAWLVSTLERFVLDRR